MKAVYEGGNVQRIYVHNFNQYSGFNSFLNSMPIATFMNKEFEFNAQTGADYVFKIIQVFPEHSLPYTLTFTTFCDNLCVEPNNLAISDRCHTCGNGVIDAG